jgi:(4-(4-[2-(gamma-L-glutamylamino)ethyl]phenoxymethyl)furan-2-yl)methanamine synthase
MLKRVVGWDVGGAHLKAAMLDDGGQVQQVIQVPCRLWLGLSELTEAIQHITQAFSIQGTTQITHAITMTGELVDLFENRRQGVSAISQLMQNQLSGNKFFYSGAQTADLTNLNLNRQDLTNFVEFEAVDRCWLSIASANWLAAAKMAAQCLQHQGEFSGAILIDIGSTTSDFIAIKNHLPYCRGLTDADRMQTGELVYTGVVRTPLMALTQEIEFRGQVTSIAAEHFATTADVYRLTGDLNDADDMAGTADGKDKTIQASSRRIARIIGRDVEEAGFQEWLNLAQAFKTKQLARLAAALEKHLTLFEASGPLVILGAGAGHFLAECLASTFSLPYRNAATLLHSETANLDAFYKISTCLPAVAVAYLAHEALIFPSTTRANAI